MVSGKILTILVLAFLSMYLVLVHGDEQYYTAACQILKHKIDRLYGYPATCPHGISENQYCINETICAKGAGTECDLLKTELKYGYCATGLYCCKVDATGPAKCIGCKGGQCFTATCRPHKVHNNKRNNYQIQRSPNYYYNDYN